VKRIAAARLLGKAAKPRSSVGRELDDPSRKGNRLSCGIVSSRRSAGFGEGSNGSFNRRYRKGRWGTRRGAGRKYLGAKGFVRTPAAANKQRLLRDGVNYLERGPIVVRGMLDAGNKIVYSRRTGRTFALHRVASRRVPSDSRSIDRFTSASGARQHHARTRRSARSARSPSSSPRRYPCLRAIIRIYHWQSLFELVWAVLRVLSAYSEYTDHVRPITHSRRCVIVVSVVIDGLYLCLTPALVFLVRGPV